MKKGLQIALLTITLSIAGAGTALADWQQDGTGWWYQKEDGTFLTGLKEADGKTYYFGDDGYMKTGWQYVNWKWYYFDGDGSRAMGWKQLDGKWYYLDPANEGAMHTYWLDLPDPVRKSKINRYYLDENGVLQTGIFYLSQETNGAAYAYQADENGVLYRNKTVRQGDTEIRYGDDGVIRFRNSETKRQAERDGTDEWQYLLSENEQQSIREKDMGEEETEENEEYEEEYSEDYDYGRSW